MDINNRGANATEHIFSASIPPAILSSIGGFNMFCERCGLRFEPGELVDGKCDNCNSDFYTLLERVCADIESEEWIDSDAKVFATLSDLEEMHGILTGGES